jgi:hypothetical protein
VTENDLGEHTILAIFNSIADAAIFIDTQRIVATSPPSTQILAMGLKR